MTGGPGGGKTTAADLFRRELGDQVVIVPESATIWFGGGFPRSRQLDARRSAQAAVFHVQRNLEDVQGALYPERILLCDRGTIDGAAYWPEGSADFSTPWAPRSSTSWHAMTQWYSSRLPQWPGYRSRAVIRCAKKVSSRHEIWTPR